MKKGFTLVEVLVVAVIIAILSATAIPTFYGYIERTSDMVCQHTASTLLNAVVVYIQDKGWNDSLIGTYDIESINAVLGNLRVKIEEKYVVDIIVTSQDDIIVIVQDSQYLGTASLGT